MNEMLTAKQTTTVIPPQRSHDASVANFWNVSALNSSQLQSANLVPWSKDCSDRWQTSSADVKRSCWNPSTLRRITSYRLLLVDAAPLPTSHQLIHHPEVDSQHRLGIP